ncbi:replication initiator [Streptomyces noursei]|uniref:replication initiator n=1 Tax=Streptomyces noursei TaxID=1971 RepID=UPI0035E1BD0E
MIRLDGSNGPGDLPPAWATAEDLTATVRTAAAAVHLRTPHSRALGEHQLRRGPQLDARPLRTFDGHEGLADEAVAAYVAKGANDTGAGTDHRLSSWADIDAVPNASSTKAPPPGSTSPAVPTVTPKRAGATSVPATRPAPPSSPLASPKTSR